MRFAGSWLVNLPRISILASWQKCEKSNPRPDFLKMAPVGEDLTKSSIHTLLNAPLTLILHSVPMQVLIPKAQSNLRPSKLCFLHNCIPSQAYRLCSNWTSSCLLAAFALLCALHAFRFAMWSTAMEQRGDTRRGHWCANTTKAYRGHPTGACRNMPWLGAGRRSYVGLLRNISAYRGCVPHPYFSG